MKTTFIRYHKTLFMFIHISKNGAHKNSWAVYRQNYRGDFERFCIFHCDKCICDSKLVEKAIANVKFNYDCLWEGVEKSLYE